MGSTEIVGENTGIRSSRPRSHGPSRKRAIIAMRTLLAMTDTVVPQIRSVDEMPADTRRGGEVRTLLSPRTVGSTSGFMGVATIAPGEQINEHYHPYSEEFLYVVEGRIVARLDDTPH